MKHSTLRPFLPSLGLLLVVAGCAQAKSVYTPSNDRPQRKATVGAPNNTPVAASPMLSPKPKSLKEFLHSTEGTYGWAPVEGDLSYDFFPDGRLHIQGKDGEATMWEGTWSLEGDQLTLTNKTNKTTKTVTAKRDGAELVLDGKHYRRYKP
ncbi:MAG TPA: hypothetical protein VF585_06030 [Chthoniobacterales bacterium]|jgi:hypothetical protein